MNRREALRKAAGTLMLGAIGSVLPKVTEEIVNPVEQQPSRAKIISAKIDGRWVDTSDWTPEEVMARLKPEPFRYV